MTAPTTAADRAFDQALDRFDVPPPSADFLARIVAAVPQDAAPVAPRWPRRTANRPWGRRALIGALALGLTSATAAATGLFGPGRIDLPRLAQLFAPDTPTTRTARLPKASAPPASAVAVAAPIKPLAVEPAPSASSIRPLIASRQEETVIVPARAVSKQARTVLRPALIRPARVQIELPRTTVRARIEQVKIDPPIGVLQRAREATGPGSSNPPGERISQRIAEVRAVRTERAMIPPGDTPVALAAAPAPTTPSATAGDAAPAREKKAMRLPDRADRAAQLRQVRELRSQRQSLRRLRRP